MSKNGRARWLCLDCREDTSKLREHYFVRSETWFDQAGCSERGMLCIGCLEQRLGRRLQPDDFPPVHINNPKNNAMSMRLVARIRG